MSDQNEPKPINPPYRSEADRRYMDDPKFCAAVHMLEGLAEHYGFTPYDLNQAAFYAALRVELRRPLSPIIAHRLRENLDIIEEARRGR